ncbi:hypothetical protein [Sphingomonas adhaesiva]|uniref:hypothetical protein n=1 Tax=Sphingomonas adhaesiva TaxID=28212 RepID=UPI002FF95DFD
MRVAPLLLVTATVFAVTIALLPHPPHVMGNAPDKIQHMTAFGTITILYCAAFPRQSLLRIGERLSFLGALIEVFQSIPALHRDCDVMDWIADTAVIVGVLLVVRIVRGRRGATP